VRGARDRRLRVRRSRQARRRDPRWSEPDALFIAHIDYIGLWGHAAGPAVDAEIDAVLDAIAAAGSAVELNTDRISDPAGVMYPSVDILRRARGRGIPLVTSCVGREVSASARPPSSRRRDA
jgi:hypothetical protein